MYTKVIKDSVLVGINRNDGANIPICEDNTDYQAYLAYVIEQTELDANFVVPKLILE